MNWRFWQKRTTSEPAEEWRPHHEEEDLMGLYLQREQTPEQQMLQTLSLLNDLPAGAPPPDAAPEPPPDPLASLSPEQQAAVEDRIAYEQYQARAALGQVGMDLVNGRPAVVDPQRHGQWSGVPAYAPPPPQAAGPPPAPELPPDPDDAPDAPIPDPSYSPAEYRTWHNRQITRAVGQAMREALAPLVQEMQGTRQATLEMRVEEAVQRVDSAVQQYAPWLGEMLGHPDFEGYFRQALNQIDPARWRNPQDVAAVAGTVAAYLRPVAAEEWQPGSTPPRYARPRSAAPPPPENSWQQQYQENYGGAPAYSDQQPLVGQPRPNPSRNPRTGQFVGRGANAAISRAAAEQTAPSTPARLAPPQQQYDDFILAAAQRAGVSAEEARAIMQDTTGDAAEQFRRKRLEALR